MHKELRQKKVNQTGEKMEVRPWKNSKVHIIPGLMPNSCFDELGLYEMTKVKDGLLSHIVIETSRSPIRKTHIGFCESKEARVAPCLPATPFICLSK